MKHLPLAILFASVTLAAQTNWTRLSPATVPNARNSTGLVWDELRGRGVMYGGFGGGVRSDTWEWDGANWQLQSVTPNPGALNGHAMAYDARRGVTVLFGGARTSSLGVGETWEWNGTAWSQRATTGPSGRVNHQMCFDAVRGVVVLFGGHVDYNAGPVLGDTWEWNGAVWIQRTPATSPTPRVYHAMAYDALRNRVLMFGGRDANNVPLAETWEYSGATWTQRTPAVSPTPRIDHEMLWDAARARIVIFSGFQTGADTWEWDGTTWLSRATPTSPSWRYAYGFAFDTKKNRALLFGGYAGGQSSETWEYGPTGPAAFTAFGTGCAGSAGTPQLAAAPYSLPWLADTFTMRLTNLPANPAAMFFGFSRTSWGAFTLPLALGPFGMPGCTLYVSVDLVVGLTVSSGAATLGLPVPNMPSLVGLSLHTQGVVVSPATNPLGLVASNAGDLRFGAR